MLAQSWKEADAKYPGGSASFTTAPDFATGTVCVSGPWTSELNNGAKKYFWYLPASGIASLGLCSAISKALGRMNAR